MKNSHNFHFRLLERFITECRFSQFFSYFPFSSETGERKPLWIMYHWKKKKEVKKNDIWKFLPNHSQEGKMLTKILIMPLSLFTSSRASCNFFRFGSSELWIRNPYVLDIMTLAACLELNTTRRVT
jgi:hypothetical protein